VLGVSGRAMLRALLAGERDPKVLAGLSGWPEVLLGTGSEGPHQVK
jgi:hypothetical protein